MEPICISLYLKAAKTGECDEALVKMKVIKLFKHVTGNGNFVVVNKSRNKS